VGPETRLKKKRQKWEVSAILSKQERNISSYRGVFRGIWGGEKKALRIKGGGGGLGKLTRV